MKFQITLLFAALFVGDVQAGLVRGVTQRNLEGQSGGKGVAKGVGKGVYPIPGSPADHSSDDATPTGTDSTATATDTDEPEAPCEDGELWDGSEYVAC